MEGADINTESGRQKIAELAFAYPIEPYRRKHGPVYHGKEPESYREWLRDEFSYRCVFSLWRETWIGRHGHFDIDHLKSRVSRPDLIRDYDNLLYLSHRINLRKGRKPLPDPCKIGLGMHLKIETGGKRIGRIIALDELGEEICETLRLNRGDEIDLRRKWIGILKCAAVTDEALFRDLVGFPKDLRNLDKLKPDDNSRRSGISKSAWHLREVRESLPEWY